MLFPAILLTIIFLALGLISLIRPAFLTKPAHQDFAPFFRLFGLAGVTLAIILAISAQDVWKNDPLVETFFLGSMKVIGALATAYGIGRSIGFFATFKSEFHMRRYSLMPAISELFVGGAILFGLRASLPADSDFPFLLFAGTCYAGIFAAVNHTKTGSFWGLSLPD